jgi:hypothetical protein
LQLLEEGHAAGEDNQALRIELAVAKEESDAAEKEVARMLSELEVSNRQRDALEAAVADKMREVRSALDTAQSAERARDHATSELARANERAAGFKPWRTSLLADNTKGLGKIVRELTTFRRLSSFREFYDIVLNAKGCTRAGRPGVAENLDYWYAPKHGATARVDGASGKWRQQLNPEAPGGLQSPFEACFMTMAMLRLGLHVREAAVLFGISAGSASQIFNTWVPFISRSLEAWTPWPDGASVAANLPDKFKRKLARTTHSKRCRIIVDCTEIRVQVVEDDNLVLRQRFVGQSERALSAGDRVEGERAREHGERLRHPRPHLVQSHTLLEVRSAALVGRVHGDRELVDEAAKDGHLVVG